MASIKNAFLVEGPVREERLAICRACPHLTRQDTCGTPVVGDDVEHEGKPYRTCGCWMPLKTALQGTACPLGKWGEPNTEAERYERAKELLSRIGDTITRDEATELRHLHRFLLSNEPDPGECPKCMAEIVHGLRQYLRNEKGETTRKRGRKPKA